jgi:drug/metabolite transporter (DMT)-like permease
LAKIAVSEGYQHFGLIFWQMVLSAAVLGLLSALRRKGLPMGLPQLRLYVIIAIVGTVLPNSASYQALVHLPSGIVSILLSLVPMLAFPVALMLGVDQFGRLRLLGLLLGLCGVLLIVGPEASLPSRAMIAVIPLALIAPLCYGFEGNIVAKWGTYGCDAVQVLLGASLVGALLVLPLTLITGQWIDPRPPWGAPDLALIGASVIHAVVYACYVWLVGRAGSVFAAQVSYLVTGFGVMWAMLLLGERYSGYVWAAMGLLFIGLFLVQPRSKTDLAARGALRKTVP